MSNTLLEDMTVYQRGVFALVEQGFSQKDIARELKKHPQSVSDAVMRSKAGLVLEAHQAIKDMLRKLDQ
jgi:DNA-binding NarL/FixJ family response regulator